MPTAIAKIEWSEREQKGATFSHVHHGGLLSWVTDATADRIPSQRGARPRFG